MKIDSKKRNLRTVLVGVFFLSFSATLVNFFLPFFLKEKGLTALEIGGLFTFGIALGSLLFSILFSKILRRIKLKTGLTFSAISNFFKTFILYIFPTTSGAILNQITGEFSSQASKVSIDTTMQHNLEEKNERKTSVNWLVIDGFGLIFGILFSIFLVNKIGFRNSFLIFSLLSLIVIFFFSRVSDDTRFKPEENSKLPKISKKLKLILFSEIIYQLALASTWALVITFLISERFSGAIFEIGILFVVLYIFMNLTAYITKERLNHLNELKTAVLGMSLLLLSALFIILSKNFYMVLFAFVIEGIGAGIWVPSKTALQWKNTEKSNREKVSGWLSGLNGFVSAIGPLMGGFLVTIINVNAPFYFKIGISIISIFVYLYVLRKS